MTCRDFDAAWNEILDAETPESRRGDVADPAEMGRLQERERTAAGHARTCEACRTSHRRFQHLRKALRASRARLPLIPGPSLDLAERILADAVRSSPRRGPGRILVPLGMALAASVLGLLLLRSRPAEGPIGRPIRLPAAPRLSLAMADATDATWDLARTTSRPATRFGLQLLEAATGSDASARPAAGGEDVDNDPDGFLHSVIRAVAPSRAESNLLQDVGEEVTAGVRPLSARAREAFGFLRTPTLERAGGPARPASPKGA